MSLDCPSMHGLGELLRRLRRERQWSQETLASRSGVAVRTLRYWEADQRQPSGMELENVLRALEAVPEQKRLAYDLAPRPYLLRLAQAPGPVGAHTEPIPVAHAGDLLRAMRGRSSKTQAQLAAELGVSVTTVIYWETMRRLPSPENLRRLCLLLNARPEETDALASHLQHLPQELEPENATRDREVLRAQYDRLSLLHRHCSPLTELATLALKRRLSFSSDPEVTRLLAKVTLIHGNQLLEQRQYAAARAAALQLLELVKRAGGSHEDWTAAANLASCFVGKRQGSFTAKAEYVLRRLAPEESPQSRARQLCDAALYFSRGRRAEEANRLLRDAEQLYQASSFTPASQIYLQVTRGRVNLTLGEAELALQDLLEAALKPPVNRWFQVYAAHAALEMGDHNACARQLQDIVDQLAGPPTLHLADYINQLSRRL